MAEGFSWTISGATILMFLGWAGTIGLFLYKRGGVEAVLSGKVDAAHAKLDKITSSWELQQGAHERYVRELEADRQKWRDEIEDGLEQRFASVHGAIQLQRDQHAELRENLAKNYMIKSEISAIETRVTSGQERIGARLEKLDERLTLVQTSILEAIKRNGNH